MCDLFVYGSLLNTSSASVALGKISLEDYQPKYLSNSALAFNVNVPIQTLSWRGYASFLNIVKSRNNLLGMAIQLSPHQIETLQKREKYYALVERCLVGDGKNKILSFEAAINEGYKKEPILEEYLNKVLSGARSFGSSFSKVFENELDQALDGRTFISGNYTFQDPEINNLTDIAYD